MIEMLKLNHLRAQPAFRVLDQSALSLGENFTVVYEWADTADESSDNLRFFRPW